MVHWFWAWVVQIHCSWSRSVKRVGEESDNRTRWIYGVTWVVSQKGGSSDRSFAGQEVSSAPGHGGIHSISSTICVMSVSLKSRKIDQQERQPPPRDRHRASCMHVINRCGDSIGAKLRENTTRPYAGLYLPFSHVHYRTQPCPMGPCQAEVRSYM